MHLTIQFSLWHSNISHTFCDYGRFVPTSTVQLSCPPAYCCGQTSALLGAVRQLWPFRGTFSTFRPPSATFPSTEGSRQLPEDEQSLSSLPFPSFGCSWTRIFQLQDRFACFSLTMPSKPLKTFTNNETYLLPQQFFKNLFLPPPVKVLP